PKRQFVLHVVDAEGSVQTFRIGPHTPTMKAEDVHLVHRLWLELTKEPGLDKIHHSDLVTLALTRLARDYTGRDRDEVLRTLRKGKDGTDGQNGGKGKDGTDRKSGGGTPPTPPVVGP